MKVNGTTPEQPPRILIVDDELSVHRMLSAYLSKHDFAVENCLDSQEVVKKVKGFGPDLVLLDLMMPTLDGVTATRRIRNLPLSSYLPIIILTAKKEVRDIVTTLEAGADDYITKPFAFEELMARIKNMLRLKQLQDRLMYKSEELNEANQQISRLNHVLVETNKQLQKKLYDFHNLFEIGNKVMSVLDFHNLIQQALTNLMSISTTRSAMLFLVSQEDGEVFELAESKGVGSDGVRNLQISRHDKLIHYLELIKKAFHVGNVTQDFQELVPRLKDLEVEAVCPLFRDDDIVGLLCLGPNVRDEEYGGDDLETLEIIANMLAVAVNNAQDYERVKALSYTDGMTGLHNYRFFRLRLKEELARTRREGSSLSLLILDVDNFKNYNDTLGHPAGDEVLRTLADILRNSVRDNDIVARYGGEEFAVILPLADKEGALALAERIRQKVEKTDFENEDIQPGGNLTISIGTATYPEDVVTEEELVQQADRALYHAKRTGRNKVVDCQKVTGRT